MERVDVNRNQAQKRDKNREHTGRQGQQGSQGQGRGQQASQAQRGSQAEADRGSLAKRGVYAPSFFSLSPRELASTSPFELMRRFTDQLDRAFEGFGSRGAGPSGEWAPPVEAFERDGRFVVRAELPGLNRDDVKVEVADGGIIIRGERKSEHEENREGFYRSEWSYGQFQRFVPLPYENANVDQAQARFDNGILEVTVPVPEGQASQRRQIPVQTGGGEGRAGLSEGKGRS
jgi:HSP20 family protein